MILARVTTPATSFFRSPSSASQLSPCRAPAAHVIQELCIPLESWLVRRLFPPLGSFFQIIARPRRPTPASPPRLASFFQITRDATLV